jgi:tRNA pseudouridine38-40 synthase
MNPMRNIVLTLSYLGGRFAGWQKTPHGDSIQEALENALLRILREKPLLEAASRTDAGVHAQGQIVHFFTGHSIDLQLLKRALNGTLPKEISVLAIQELPQDFHSTLNSVKKEYRYQICNGPVQLPFHKDISWHVPLILDVGAMRDSVRHLLGIHDFSAFCNDRASYDRDPVCHLEEISLTLLPQGRLIFTIVGNRFLYKMVRNIVGTLVHVGRGKLSAEQLPQILQSKQRSNAGVTAPAHGLCLHRVYYKDI